MNALARTLSLLLDCLDDEDTGQLLRDLRDGSDAAKNELKQLARESDLEDADRTVEEATRALRQTYSRVDPDNQ